jgi:hypothetical protein
VTGFCDDGDELSGQQQLRITFKCYTRNVLLRRQRSENAGLTFQWFSHLFLVIWLFHFRENGLHCKHFDEI